MYLFYILCSGSCKSSAALCVLLTVLSHENISLFLASTLNDEMMKNSEQETAGINKAVSAVIVVSNKAK